jgi:dienelactone hydrolase
LHELNGLSPAPLDFSKELASKGWRVYAPALFGKYGDNDPKAALSKLKKDPRWKLYDKDDSGVIVDDVRAMSSWISGINGGQRVIVMGNCLTGTFALPLLAEKHVKAAITCQPAFPLPSTFEAIFKIQPLEKREAWGISSASMERAVDAMKGGKKLWGFHYLEDPIAPMDKFYSLHRALEAQGIGGRFRPVVLRPARLADNDPGWWDGLDTEVRRSFLKPHNTVTESGSPCDRRRMREVLYAKLEEIRREP